MLAFCIIGTTGLTWYAAKDATPGGGCCGMSDPCDLATALSVARTNDTVYVDATGTDTAPIDLCQESPLRISLSIIGYKGKPKLQCTNITFTILFFSGSESNESVEVLIVNLHFISGFIVGCDIDLTLTNSILENATIKMMSPYILIPFYKYDFALMRDIFASKKQVESFTSLQICTWANLSLQNTQWKSIVAENMSASADLNDVIGVYLDIHLIAINVQLNTNHSDMANRRIQVLSALSTHIHIEDSHFHGWNPLETESVIMCDRYGGIAIDIFSKDTSSTSSAIIQIKDTLFENLGWKNNWGSFLENGIAPTYAAFTLFIQKESLNNSFFHMNNVSFIGNDRAVGIYVPGNLSWVLFDNCKFKNNSNMFDGGAFIANPTGNSDNSKILIINCIFDHNHAGHLIRRDDGKLLVKHLVIYPGMDYIHVYEIYFDTSKNAFVANIGTPLGNTSFTRQARGSGGALFLNGGVVVKVENTTFTNNVANEFGGTLFIGHGSYVFLIKCALESSDSGSYSIAGELFMSLGIMHLTGTTFVINQAVDGKTMIHQTGTKEMSLNIHSFSVRCPSNRKLIVTNASYISIEAIKHITRPYTHMYIQCDHCESGYTLHQGNISVSINSDNSQTVEHYHGQCHPCPYGANCANNLTPKPNFWGYIDEGEITFTQCPMYYSCGLACTRYNQCAANRSGQLCAECDEGFTEGFFSAKCVENRHCNDYWIIAVILSVGVVYSLFLLFETDFKRLLIIQPFSQWFKSKSAANMSKVERMPTKYESGAFLIMLFYYFQDATLMYISTPYVIHKRQWEVSTRTIIGGIFKFRLDLFHLANNICVFVGMRPTSKLMIKLLFLPFILGVLALVYCTAKLYGHISSHNHVKEQQIDQKKIHDLDPKSKKHKGAFLTTRACIAMMLAFMFSFQKLAVTCFTLLSCVELQDGNFLFIHGNVECYQPWQIVILIYTVISVMPFGLYLCISPHFLKTGQVNTFTFFLGCAFPLPFLSYLIFVKVKNKVVSDIISAESVVVYQMLQGPYHTKSLFKLNICWAGVLLFRKIILILLHTFVGNTVSRLLWMCVVCLFSLTIHMYTMPCKETKANIAGLVSGMALLIVAVINLVRSIFDTAQINADGHLVNIVHKLDYVENALLIWIPLIGVSVICLVILVRLCCSIFMYIKRKRHGNVASEVG